MVLALLIKCFTSLVWLSSLYNWCTRPMIMSSINNKWRVCIVFSPESHVCSNVLGSEGEPKREAKWAHRGPVSLHSVAWHGSTRVHPPCPHLHQPLISGSYCRHGPRPGALQVQYLLPSSWAKWMLFMSARFSYFADLVNSSLYGPAIMLIFALCSAPQCRGWAHRNVHRHWQHATTDQGQKHSQRPGFSQTYPHTTQLPSSDRGEKLEIIPYVVKLPFKRSSVIKDGQGVMKAIQFDTLSSGKGHTLQHTVQTVISPHPHHTPHHTPHPHHQANFLWRRVFLAPFRLRLY